MQLTAAIKGKQLATDEKTVLILQKMKDIIHRFDQNADVILFGSRARGDWHEESDWDFLMLTDETNTEELSDKIRKLIADEIESVTFDGIFVILKNKKVWEDDHAVTTLYKSIEEDGLAV